ncbi:MAG: hypothetical protein J6Q95_01430, partial [Alistipes sp.]|nr:hypothetical protein [Alistipes sp.]
MTVYDKNGDNEENIIKTTEFNTDIPVQRNHLTTIIGNVLTTATEINVDINDDFCDECEIVKNYIGVASARELQAALDKEAKAGEINVINFEADINAVAEKYNPIKITEIAETTIILNGNDYKFEGCMQIIGGSNATPNNAHTVFQNIKFETADASSYLGTSFIYCNDQNGNTRYPDNVTITGCAFDGDAASAVGVKLRSLFGKLVVKNTTATDLHSLVQLTSCGDANVTINEVKIENSKNGISLGATATAVIKNSNIATTVYGVRADGCTATTTFENTTIEAKQPVIVRNMKSDSNYVLNFATTSLKAADYQVIFTTNSDDAEYAAPAMGTYTLNCEDANYRVFPVVEDYTIEAYNANDLLRWAWLANNSEETYNVVFMNDITLPQNVIAEGEGCYYYTTEEITVTNGIPSGSNWPVISDYETSYNAATGAYEYYGGKVDGNDQTLSGLRINQDLGASGFLCWTKGASVENLTFNDAAVYNKGGNIGETYTGIVIGRCWNGSYISNVHITNSSVIGKHEVGALAGRVYHRTEKASGEWMGEKQAYVVYCSTDENTHVQGHSNVGGIVGHNYGCVIGQCVNNADVTGVNQVGGIAGSHQSYYKKTDAFLIGCTTTDKATITATNGSAGGFAGYTRRDNSSHTNTRVWIVGCASQSTVVGDKAGSMIGYSVKNYGEWGACLTASYAVTNATSYIGTGSDAQVIAAYNYTSATDATQEDVDAMNAGIVEFNDSPDNIYVDGETGAVMLKRWALVDGVPVLQ